MCVCKEIRWFHIKFVNALWLSTQQSALSAINNKCQLQSKLIEISFYSSTLFHSAFLILVVCKNAMNWNKKKSRKIIARWLAPPREGAICKKSFQALKLDYFNDSSFFNVHKQFQGKARSLFFNFCHVHITKTINEEL